MAPLLLASVAVVFILSSSFRSSAVLSGSARTFTNSSSTAVVMSPNSSCSSVSTSSCDGVVSAYEVIFDECGLADVEGLQS